MFVDIFGEELNPIKESCWDWKLLEVFHEDIQWLFIVLNDLSPSLLRSSVKVNLVSLGDMTDNWGLMGDHVALY